MKGVYFQDFQKKTEKYYSKMCVSTVYRHNVFM